ncbi:MAG: aminoglycoside phosphotransferase family protein [Tepidiformaceae bacterium]
MTALSIPESFARCMRDVYGDAGNEWLARLPAIVAECEQRWSIRVEAPFVLSYNYVAPATRADGTPVVLKAGYPCKELRNEIDALRLYAGRGIGALLESDSELGAMLLERLSPGEPLTTVTDDIAATALAAVVMRELWAPAPLDHDFPTTATWGRGFDRLRATFGRNPPFNPALVDRAEDLFASLEASSAAPVLLHGDLHHDNILSAQRRPWLAIDPKGVVGEPAYETGAFIRNPSALYELPDPGAVMHRRVAQLSEELGLDRQRIRNWGIAEAVLSAWWSYEDHGRGWERAIICAELLANG